MDETSAFEKLSICLFNLAENPNILQLLKLTGMIESQQREGVKSEIVNKSARKNLKRKLERELVNVVHSWYDVG